MIAIPVSDAGVRVADRRSDQRGNGDAGRVWIARDHVGNQRASRRQQRCVIDRRYGDVSRREIRAERGRAAGRAGVGDSAGEADRSIPGVEREGRRAAEIGGGHEANAIGVA